MVWGMWDDSLGVCLVVVVVRRRDGMGGQLSSFFLRLCVPVAFSASTKNNNIE